MRAIVTGATGLLGANIVRELLAAGQEVRALVRATSDTRALDGLRVERVHGDVLEPATLAPALRGCDVLFHSAAVFAYSGLSSERLHALAVDGTLNVLNAAVQTGVRRVVLTSSSVVFGSSLDPSARDESAEFADRDPPPYALAKLRQHREAVEFAGAHGLALSAACPTMCIGAHGQTLGPSNGVIVTYLSDPFKLTYPGGCNMVSVRDVARGHVIIARAGRPGESYLLGSENLEWSLIHRTISELCGVPGPLAHANHTSSFLAATAAELASRLTGRPPLTTRAQAKMVGRYYWYDHSKAAALGYAPRPARQALAEAIGWLAASHHVSREVRTQLRLSREVYRAREAMRQEEAAGLAAA